MKIPPTSTSSIVRISPSENRIAPADPRSSWSPSVSGTIRTASLVDTPAVHFASEQRAGVPNVQIGRAPSSRLARAGSARLPLREQAGLGLGERHLAREPHETPLLLAEAGC